MHRFSWPSNVPDEGTILPHASPGTRAPLKPLWLLWWIPPVVLALLGHFIDPVEYMRSGARAYSTLRSISGCLFLAAFGYIPALILFRTLLAMIRAWRRSRRDTSASSSYEPTL